MDQQNEGDLRVLPLSELLKNPKLKKSDLDVEVLRRLRGGDHEAKELHRIAAANIENEISRWPAGKPANLPELSAEQIRDLSDEQLSGQRSQYKSLLAFQKHNWGTVREIATDFAKNLAHTTTEVGFKLREDEMLRRGLAPRSDIAVPEKMEVLHVVTTAGKSATSCLEGKAKTGSPPLESEKPNGISAAMTDADRWPGLPFGKEPQETKPQAEGDNLSRKGNPCILGEADLVNLKQAEEYLGIKRRQLQYLMRKGTLEARGGRSNRRVTTESLKKYVPPQDAK